MSDVRLAAELQRLLIGRGATFVACADITRLPQDVRNSMPIGVSIGAALDPAVVAGIVDGPTEEYRAEYHRVNALLGRLADDGAEFLRQRGFGAVACKVTVDELDEEALVTPLPHKTVARLAGVGWIGRCALLITRQYGSAVRYNSVLTDAPLPVGTPTEASQCGECTACVDACPAGAPSGKLWEPGFERADFFDAFACCRQAVQNARKMGMGNAICGICIAVCPNTGRYLSGREGKADE